MLYNWGQGLILVALKIDIWTSAYVGMLTFGGNVNFFTQRLYATATNNVSRCQIDLMDHKIESIDVSNSLCCSIVFGQSHNNWVFQRERLRTTYSLKKPEITSQGRIWSSQEFCQAIICNDETASKEDNCSLEFLSLFDMAEVVIKRSQCYL